MVRQAPDLTAKQTDWLVCRLCHNHDGKPYSFATNIRGAGAGVRKQKRYRGTRQSKAFCRSQIKLLTTSRDRGPQPDPVNSRPSRRHIYGMSSLQLHRYVPAFARGAPDWLWLAAQPRLGWVRARFTALLKHSSASFCSLAPLPFSASKSSPLRRAVLLLVAILVFGGQSETS